MSEPIFRPMQQSDVKPALAIIEAHDDDDAAWARETYATSLEGHYVLELNSKTIGVTGASPLDRTDRSYSISWTYLTKDFIGRGYGRVLLESVLDEVRAEGGRKVFVNTSDYYDPEDGDIYRDARETYRSVGFIEEMRHNDYYDKGEALIAYGVRLEDRGADVASPPDNQQIQITNIDEIPECDGAYWLAWELGDEGTDPSSFNMIVEQVKEWEGRTIFMAFPSDLQNIGDFMTRCRFKKDGCLFDYYEDGVDELHYRFDIL